MSETTKMIVDELYQDRLETLLSVNPKLVSLEPSVVAMDGFSTLQMIPSKIDNLHHSQLHVQL